MMPVLEVLKGCFICGITVALPELVEALAGSISRVRVVYSLPSPITCMLVHNVLMVKLAH